MVARFTIRTHLFCITFRTWQHDLYCSPGRYLNIHKLACTKIIVIWIGTPPCAHMSRL